jgi:thioester reductase-like protein
MSHYLSSALLIEPLINRWYAWSYLIPPASAALYTANSHVKILESFLESPQLHQAALNDPAMRGGPFIHYGGDRVPELQALLDRTRQDQAELLQLAEAIQGLEKLLESADGYSLEPLYEKVPAMLKGYVELVYDGRNHASIRFLEGLLYRSSYYKTGTQAIALYHGDVDQRKFVLSTPRLEDEQSIQLQIPFHDPRLDRLFEMRWTGGDYDEIYGLLGIERLTLQQKQLFASFFTEAVDERSLQEQSLQTLKSNADAVRIRYFGHACVLIETASISILCDPLISNPNPSGLPRYSYADLPDVIDYALITHNHQDHVMFETLLQLRHKIRTVVVPKSNRGSLLDPSLKLILTAIGFDSVRELDELEAIAIPDGEIVGLPVLGEHGDLNISTKIAYYIQLQDYSILCAADSNNIEPRMYDHLAHLLGRIDVIFIGMECEGAPYTWAYGALLSQPISRKMAQTRRLDGSDCDRAIQLIQRFEPQQVYIYAMGQEPWLTHITSIEYTEQSRPILESNRLVEFCRQQQIYAERLYGCKEIFLDETTFNHLTIHPVSGAYPISESSVDVARITPKNEDFVPAPPIQVWLADLALKDIKFSLDQSSAEPKLKCNAPKGILTAELQAQLKQRKPEIIQFLSSPSQPQIDLAAEAILDAAIQPAPMLVDKQPQHILLTGATGFLGVFLLDQLLQQTQTTIYCLIRAESDRAAQQKLQHCFEDYKLPHDALQSRLVAIASDLAKPQLGLTTDSFQMLARQIDCIYHNGAWVNHTMPYSQLKATNVTGTAEILKLACLHRTKPLHFISTISVFAANHSSGIQTVTESDLLDPSRVPSSGYAQSKWVAEKLVAIAQSRGLPAKIYRPGAISGHSQTGVFNRNDFLYKLIQGCIQLGAVPTGEMQLNLLPVDYVSQAIIYLSQATNDLMHPSFNQTFHLIHPQPGSSTMLFEFLRSQGYPIQSLPYEQWRNHLLTVAQTDSNHPLYAIMPLFSSSHADHQSDRPILEFDQHNTLTTLNQTDLQCPSIDTNLLQTYLKAIATILVEDKISNSPTAYASPNL